MADPVKEVCTNCFHCHANSNGKPECWHDPPTVLGEAVFGQPIMAGGPPTVTWVTTGARPPCRPEWNCAKFQPRPSTVN